MQRRRRSAKVGVVELAWSQPPTQRRNLPENPVASTQDVERAVSQQGNACLDGELVLAAIVGIVLPGFVVVGAVVLKAHAHRDVPQRTRSDGRQSRAPVW